MYSMNVYYNCDPEGLLKGGFDPTHRLALVWSEPFDMNRQVRERLEMLFDMLNGHPYDEDKEVLAKLGKPDAFQIFELVPRSMSVGDVVMLMNDERILGAWACASLDWVSLESMRHLSDFNIIPMYISRGF